MTLEERVAGLEEKFDKLLAWTRSELSRLEQDSDESFIAVSEEFEKLTKPKKNNIPANLWSDEEKSYLSERLTGVETPRPVLLSLVEKWEEKFNKARSYDSLRKMWSRMKA